MLQLAHVNAVENIGWVAPIYVKIAIAGVNRFHYPIDIFPYVEVHKKFLFTQSAPGMGGHDMMRNLAAVFILLQFAWAGLATAACDLPSPAGAIILKVEGQIQACNTGLEVRLDLDMIEALPKKVIKTQNPWEQGVVTYEGVLLRDLLDYVKANGTVISLTALNDYRADISVEDARAIDVILAYKRNGELMPVREKGPLFVVFPFTDDPSLAIESRYAQSVWQVSRITVK